MLLAIALVLWGWGMGNLYIYLEKRFSNFESFIEPVLVVVFSAGAIAILVAWFSLGVGAIRISSPWS